LAWLSAIVLEMTNAPWYSCLNLTRRCSSVFVSDGLQVRAVCLWSRLSLVNYWTRCAYVGTQQQVTHMREYTTRIERMLIPATQVCLCGCSWSLC
jgi:hypothetical protein